MCLATIGCTQISEFIFESIKLVKRDVLQHLFAMTSNQINSDLSLTQNISQMHKIISTITLLILCISLYSTIWVVSCSFRKETVSIRVQ